MSQDNGSAHAPDRVTASPGDDAVKGEALFRLIGEYHLHWQERGIGHRLTDWIGDLIWSLRVARRLGGRRAVQTFLDMTRLRTGPVDYAFYRMQTRGTPWEKLDPVRHYVLFGAEENFDPAPGFDTRFYLRAHDDVAAANVNPFAHYLRRGRRENRRREPSARIRLWLDALVEQRRPPSEFSLSKALPAFEALAPEETGSHEWMHRDAPDKPMSALGLYDIRPDDVVIDEAACGTAFLERHRLLSDAPDWEAAVDEINAAGAVGAQSEGRPVVSIVIPVYGQLAFTLNCLHSLVAHRSKYAYEIIVGDDDSPDDSSKHLSSLQAVRYVRHDHNSGFIGNCNETASHAVGDYLVFLNNDTRVCAGWLDALIDSFDIFVPAGLVGSKLFYPDGSLQEAGGIVWRDGAWNYGRNDDPNRPRYSYARDVDYVSGASIAIPRQTWENLGGFDNYYAPAYYEDTDFAFRVREAGKRVIMQPLSRVIHYEGQTSGKDVSQGVKAYQIENARKFDDRWADTLKTHRAVGDSPWLERDRGVTRRVLVVDACNPTPGMDAGSVATISLIREYQSLGYLVSFVPEDNFLYQRESVSLLQGMGVECHYAPFVVGMSNLLRSQGELYDVIHVIRADVAFKNLDLLKTLAPRAKLIYLNADLHYLRMERQAAVEGRPELLSAAVAMKAKEMAVVDAVDVTMVHSSVEVDILEKERPDASVVYTPLLEKVTLPRGPVDVRIDFMFLGGYGHPPNVDAAIWLIDEIWPELSVLFPSASLLIVGANPPKELLDRASTRVIVTGTVAELTPWFERARVFLAALRYGAGAKGKVLASMGHGVPVVATAIAAEGMPFSEGVDIFEANTAEEIVRRASDLYKAEVVQWEQHSAAAQAYVAKHHGLDAGIRSLKTALEAAYGNDVVAGRETGANTRSGDRMAHQS